MLNCNVIWSVLRRNVQSYFSGVLGYLVIVLFVTVAAFCAFSPKFFANNLANLDQLSAVFPVLLLVMVPAITMSTWAEERKLGTDEILFTLPASDTEILLGKYLSALMVYTIALAFSLTQLFVLAWIGNPDWGVVFTTYVGYWLAGAALISAGMFASVLTGSTTVAYVLGATLCAIPVFVGSLAPGNTLIQSLSLSSQLREFAMGMIPLSGVLYFVGLTVFMLYLNMVFITRRHWARKESAAMGAQFAVRAVFLAFALISVNFMADKSAAFFGSRVDLTKESMYTLSSATQETIEAAKEKERSVTIQAFLSSDVPQKYVYARKQLVGLLQQYDRIAGNTIDVRFVDVRANSTEAREARTLEIEPIRDISEVGGKQVEQDVYLGVVVESNVDRVTIPFLDGQTSMEYELTRALSAVTTRRERLKVGVLETDGLRLEAPPGMPAIRNFFGTTLDKLKQEYKLSEVTRDQLAELVKAGEKDDSKDEKDKEESSDEKDKDEKKANDKPDVLVVVQPSSLTQSAMENLVKYVEQGNPTLLIDDPVPFFPYVFYRPEDLGITNAPRQERPTPDSGLSWITNVEQLPVRPDLQQQMMQMQQQFSRMPPQFARQMMERFFEENPEARPKYEPKADNGTASSLMKAIGIEWNNGQVVWDLFDPHPEFTPAWDRQFFGNNWPKAYGRLGNAFLFVGENNGAENAFNKDDPISARIQELMFIYPGTVRKDDDSKLNFRPLVTTGPTSGVIPWEELTFEEITTREVVDQFTGERKDTVTEPRKSRLTNLPLVRLKARPVQPIDDNTHVVAAHVTSDAKKDKPGINVVFIADIDFISDYYFQQAGRLNSGDLDEPADNTTFLMNAIDVLAAGESLASIENRRAQPRRLIKIQGEVQDFRKERVKAQQVIEKEIGKELEDAEAALKEKTEKITQESDMDIFRVGKKLGEAKEEAERKFNAKKKKLDEQLEIKVSELKAKEQEQIDQLELKVRTAAVLLPPIPALLLGLIVLVVRMLNERKQVVDSRRHA